MFGVLLGVSWAFVGLSMLIRRWAEGVDNDNAFFAYDMLIAGGEPFLLSCVGIFAAVGYLNRRRWSIALILYLSIAPMLSVCLVPVGIVATCSTWRQALSASRGASYMLICTSGRVLLHIICILAVLPTRPGGCWWGDESGPN